MSDSEDTAGNYYLPGAIEQAVAASTAHGYFKMLRFMVAHLTFALRWIFEAADLVWSIQRLPMFWINMLSFSESWTGPAKLRNWNYDLKPYERPSVVINKTH